MLQTAFHGTTERFETFRPSASGIHVGSFDQAVNVATQRLAKLPLKKFAALPEGEGGFRGVIAEVVFELGTVLRVDDARTAKAWAAEILRARALGVDTLLYANEFEGRQKSDSFVIIDQARLRIVGFR